MIDATGLSLVISSYVCLLSEAQRHLERRFRSPDHFWKPNDPISLHYSWSWSWGQVESISINESREGQRELKSQKPKIVAKDRVQRWTSWGGAGPGRSPEANAFLGMKPPEMHEIFVSFTAQIYNALHRGLCKAKKSDFWHLIRRLALLDFLKSAYGRARSV